LGRLDVIDHNLQGKHGCLTISRKSEVPAVREEIVSLLVGLGYPQRDVFAVRLATEEALLNAIEHGNQCDERKRVTVSYRLGAEKAEITVSDEGAGFDPDSVPDCTAADNLAKPRGRGIALMRGFMDSVEFGGKGNTLILVKFNSSRREGPPTEGAARRE
jgi:serine/threonine-protein kinase RsbW